MKSSATDLQNSLVDVADNRPQHGNDVICIFETFLRVHSQTIASDGCLAMAQGIYTQYALPCSRTKYNTGEHFCYQTGFYPKENLHYT